jgi:hypothetical protein
MVVMKRLYSILALSSVLGLLALMPREAFSQGGRDRGQVCVYEHVSYGGWERCFGIGESVADLGNLRNQISSVRIQGRAEITLYQHPDFGGKEVTIDGSVPDLKQISRFWNDEVDSLRVDNAGFRGRPNRGEFRADRVCVYQHVGFQGNSQCFDAGDDVEDLRSIGWNDGISSIRVFGRIRAAFFEHADFQGERLIVDGDMSDLTQVGARGRGNWNDRISSVRVEGGRGRRGDWRN